MKKISGYIDVRALGCYDFEFYVEDNDIIVMCSDGIIDSNIEYKNKVFALADLKSVKLHSSQVLL